MTSEGLGEIFEGDSADTCAGKFPLTLMGGRAEGLACADPGARTPLWHERNYTCFSSCWSSTHPAWPATARRTGPASWRRARARAGSWGCRGLSHSEENICRTQMSTELLSWSRQRRSAGPRWWGWGRGRWTGGRTSTCPSPCPCRREESFAESMAGIPRIRISDSLLSIYI